MSVSAGTSREMGEGGGGKAWRGGRGEGRGQIVTTYHHYDAADGKGLLFGVRALTE